jgi:4-carboxymuconolactone decarboxylase
VTRQTRIDATSLTGTQLEAFNRLRTTTHLGSDGYFHGPHDPWLLNGELSLQLEDLVSVILGRLSMDRGLVELAIAMTGRFWEANLEWAGHSLLAVEHGIPQQMIDDILAGVRPAGTKEQMLVYDVTSALQTGHAIPPDLYARAVSAFGERGLMEIVVTAGTYTTVCMTLNAFECQVAPGVPAPFVRAHR